MWKLLQLSIMAAVMCGNIYYDWTPNPYLVGLLGLGAAYIVTLVLSSLFGRRRPELRDYPPSHHKSTVGARWDTNNLTHGIPSAWVRNDASDLVEVTPQTPSLERIIREAHPLPRTDALGRKRLKPPGRH